MARVFTPLGGAGQGVRPYDPADWNPEWKLRDGPRWVLTDRFNTTYYSGLDVGIWFGDLYLEDLVGLQYQLQELVMPQFSYADYTWRQVARGQRQLQGSFTLNFKEAAYLYALRDRLAHPEAPAAAPARSDTQASSALARKASVQGLSFQEFVGVVGRDTRVQRSTLQSGNEILDSLIRTFWAPTVTVDKYGPPPDQAHRPFLETGEGFTITLKFGDPGNPDPEQRWGTLRRLLGVELTGVAQVLEDSGRPVLEEYQFIARDLA